MKRPKVGRNAVKLLSRRFTVRIFMNLARLTWLWISCSVALACVVFQRLVAGVFEFVRKQADGFVENFILDLVEFVEERFGVGDFGKFQTLLFQIFAVEIP